MFEPFILPATDVVRPARAERRVAIRCAASAETECQAITPTAGACTAWVRDLSASGIGLMIDRAYASGTWLTIELDNAEQGTSLRLRARVIHAVEFPNDHWLHGCAFERDLSDAELQAFVE